MSANPRSGSSRRDWFGLRRLFRADAAAVRQSLVALVVSALTAVVAGVILASITDTLEELPGLLLLVPAAIALRGNVFGALGSRLGTAIHTGTFVLRFRSDTVVGQNVIASIVLSLVTSVGVAVLAKGVAIAFDVSPVMSLAEFIVVSVIGGLLASSVVLLISLLLAAGSVRFRWDLDNVTAPLVTATGDLVTVPALLVASWLIGGRAQAVTIAAVSTVGALVGLILVARSSRDLLRRIVRESLPVLLLAGLFDLIAGITIQKRQDEFLAFEALLILLPGFLGAAGALGGILSSRLATGFHLGLVEPAPVPTRVARSDMRSVLALAMPVFAVLGVASWAAAEIGGFTEPGLVRLLGVALTAGILATVFVVGVGYYGTLAAVRLGLDPDTYGIPLVTASLDFVGAFTLILAIVLWGVA